MSDQRRIKDINYAAKDVDKKAFNTEKHNNLHVDRNQFNYSTPQDKSKQRQQRKPVEKAKPAVVEPAANQAPPPKPANQAPPPKPANQAPPPKPANQAPTPKPANQQRPAQPVAAAKPPPANQTRPPQQQTYADNWDAEINRDLERLKRFGLED